MRFLVLTLRGPMMSFGGPIIDGAGNTCRLPGLSCITGLIANALGYDRSDYAQLTALQDAITFAAREDIAGALMNDFQTAKLQASDKGWTRFGVEGRTGGGSTYDNPVILNRPFLADHVVTVVVSVADDVFLDRIASAFERPARPLFLGRKAFLPSGPIVDVERPAFIEAEDALAAIRSVPLLFSDAPADLRASWPEACEGGGEVKRVFDVKDYHANRHSSSRRHREGRVTVAAA